MRNLFLLMLLAGSCMTASAQNTADKAKVLSSEEIQKRGGIQLSQIPTTDVLNVGQRVDNDLFRSALANEKTPMKPSKTATFKPKAQIQRVGEAVDTVQYFTAAQSYFEGYSFNHAGGDVITYNLGVVVDGTKVTFTNLFALYDPTSTYSSSTDNPVVGTYDPEAKTVTIPTKTNFAEATIAGYFYGYYPAVLLAGTLSEDKTLSPDQELVFNVEGDFECLTTDQAVCAFMYTPDGSQNYGVNEAFKKLYIQKPTAGSKLVTMTDELSMGQTFPDYAVSKSYKIVNLGQDAAEFAAETEADDDAFTVDPSVGEVAGQSAQSIDVTFKASKAGDYEGLSTFEWEGGDAFLVQYEGTVIPYPDYSAIIKNGDITLTTDIDYPFEMDVLDDGTQVAASATKGYGGVSSKLYATFTVPEGQMGTFSWKGVSNNSAYWYYNAGGVFVDDEKFSAFTGANEDLSDAVEFAPGTHVVRFQYDDYYYTGVAENRLYVYDLDLQLSDLPADGAELTSKEVNLGNFIVTEDTPATGNSTITIKNKGANKLTLKSATIDNDVFFVSNSVSAVSTMETMTIPVTMEAKKSGLFEATATLETSAGTFTVPVKALVRDMPDFQDIVKEGDFTFTTDASNPWLVENGVAYNSTAKQLDYTYSYSTFKASFTVPEGKLGILSWDGDINSAEPADPQNWYTNDYGQISIQHPMTGGQHDVPGGVHSASSDYVYGSDEYWATFLYCIPGDHYVEFKYVQIGDTLCSGEDRMQIKDLSLKLIDYDEYKAELMTPSVKFDSTFVGYNRYTTATVTLKNVGSKDLEVTEIPGTSAFYGIVPTSTAAFSKTLDVTLWFYPDEVGDYKDSITIKTNAGDFKVACEGVAKSSEGYLLVGDFEDNAQNWTAYDADKDGENWNLGYNLFGGDFPEYCHSGKQLLGSASYSYYNGDITPNNWAFSPYVTIPEEGAMLTWYAAEQSKKRAGDAYSVYVATADEIADPDNLDNLTPVLSETLDSTYVDRWAYHEFDLSKYAGKTVSIAFRHHNCTGCWLLKLDDVFVWTMDKWDEAAGIQNTSVADDSAKRVMRQEYYSVSGERLSTPAKGINIVRTVFTDGTCKTTKVMRK